MERSLGQRDIEVFKFSVPDFPSVKREWRDGDARGQTTDSNGHRPRIIARVNVNSQRDIPITWMDD